MTYVDFDVLSNKPKGAVFLDEELAKFLFKQKGKFLASQSENLSSGKTATFSIFNSPKFSFSHNLVRSGENQWHIIENKNRGAGGFGSVNGSKFKIILSSDKKGYLAQLVPVSDVVKIQKSSADVPYDELLNRTIKEAKKQKKHGVQVVAVVGAEDKVITVLEDCGISLDKLLPFNPSDKYSFQFRLAVAAHIASEMLLLQQNGVVHRDLKPANICYKELSKGQFQIIFIDFGLAEEVESKNNFARSGTPYYMAPEVIQGRGSTYQSDMYALSAIFGEIFGATNILKYKQKVRQVAELTTASYCFDGLFTDYDVSEIDPYLLDDIKSLLFHLQNIKPGERPTINHVNKFLITLPARMDAYKNFNENWAIMLQHFEQFEAYHQQMNLLKSTHHLLKFKNNLLHEKSPLNHAFNRTMLQKRETIYHHLTTLSLPSSHFRLSERLIRENRSVDFEDEDRPYPNLGNLIQIMAEENLKFKRALSSFDQCTHVIMDGKQLAKKFINTNSTGILKIAHVLRSTDSPLEKLQKLQQIGYSKTEKGFFYFFSHSKLIGKGRQENVEKLYQKLARVDPLKEQDEYFAKSQLDAITEFIQNTVSFTH